MNAGVDEPSVFKDRLVKLGLGELWEAFEGKGTRENRPWRAMDTGRPCLSGMV